MVLLRQAQDKQHEVARNFASKSDFDVDMGSFIKLATSDVTSLILEFQPKDSVLFKNVIHSFGGFFVWV